MRYIIILGFAILIVMTLISVYTAPAKTSRGRRSPTESTFLPPGYYTDDSHSNRGPGDGIGGSDGGDGGGGD